MNPYSATGTADTTARFGRLTLVANALVEQAYANAPSDTTPNLLRSTPADTLAAFEDKLTLSTGSTARLEFRVDGGLLPGCGPGTGFDCNVENANLSEAFIVYAGSGGCDPAAARSPHS